MGTFLFNLFQSSVFWVLLGLWIIFCIFDASRLKKLSERLIDLGVKPIIFENDQAPMSVPFYFRKNFETISVAFKDFIVNIGGSFEDFLIKSIIVLKDKIYNPDRPHRIMGYSFLLFLFVFFVWADSVGIVSALDAFGIISFSIPGFLRYYEIAAAVGSLFAVIIGIELSREISAEKSVFTDWDEKRSEDKYTSKQLAKLLTIAGFVTVIFIGLLRLYELEVFESINNTMLNLIQTVLYVLVPFNTVLATALITGEFLKGLYVALIVLLSLFVVVAWLLDKVFKVLGYTLPVLVDFSYRIILALVNIILYFIFTPVLIVISAISSPFQSRNH